jgi:DNA polymerase III alpha subunit
MLPLFKSHYSLGRSILTLEDKDELSSNEPDSIVTICLKHKIKSPILVEDSMGGFLEAYTNFTKHKINFIYGLRITVCDSISKKDEESRSSESKFIVFMKNSSGYEKLIKLYSDAAKEGFYYYPRTDYKSLEDVWTEDLQLCVPFYDSFIYNNSFCNNTCVPKINFTKLTYFEENNNLISDSLIKNKLSNLKVKTEKTKSIYYYKNSDFKSYLTFRCINKRTTLDKPELTYMSSDRFSFESWDKQKDG